MSLRVRRTAAARADIDGIADWIFEQSGSAETTLRWFDDLKQRFRAISDAPGTGTERPEFGHGVRSSPFGNYLVFFRATKRTLFILRVIHGGRDLRRAFRLE